MRVIGMFKLKKKKKICIKCDEEYLQGLTSKFRPLEYLLLSLFPAVITTSHHKEQGIVKLRKIARLKNEKDGTSRNILCGGWVEWDKSSVESSYSDLWNWAEWGQIA